MNTNSAPALLSHAEFCVQQAQLCEDFQVKQQWSDLANGWLMLEEMKLQLIKAAKRR